MLTEVTFFLHTTLESQTDLFAYVIPDILHYLLNISLRVMDGWIRLDSIIE